MLRPVLVALSLMTLAGCATTGGNSYSYDADGDYYSGPAGADVVIDSTPSYYGGPGFGHGYGYGSGFGYGYGYGGIYSPWGYGYLPVVWWPGNSQPDEYVLRQQRIERDRVGRVALVWRPTVQAPTALMRVSPGSGLPVSDFRRSNDDARYFRARAPSSIFAPAGSRGSRDVSRSNEASAPGFDQRASTMPAPIRPAPVPQSPTRKQ